MMTVIKRSFSLTPDELQQAVLNWLRQIKQAADVLPEPGSVDASTITINVTTHGDYGRGGRVGVELSWVQARDDGPGSQPGSSPP